MNSEILKELEINRNDKIAVETQVENYKKSFANELVNGGLGTEMSMGLKLNHTPLKLKKPLKLRFKEKMNNFKNKLKIVFGVYGD